MYWSFAGDVSYKKIFFQFEGIFFFNEKQKTLTIDEINF